MYEIKKEDTTMYHPLGTPSEYNVLCIGLSHKLFDFCQDNA